MIAVLGAGAVGSWLGARLAQAGEDVTLICRGKHLHAIEEKGLMLGPEIISVTAQEKLEQKPDILIVTTKAYDLRGALLGVQEHLGKDVTVVCVQNGLGWDEEIAEIVSEAQLVHALIYTGLTILVPGEVTVHGEQPTQIYGKRAEAIEKLLTKAKLACEVPANGLDARTTKFIVNCGINALAATRDVANGALLEEPLRSEMLSVIDEASAVMEKKGHRVRGSPAERALATCKATAENKNGMLQDLERGKQTEIEYLNGRVVAWAEEYGLLTPRNAALSTIIRAKKAL